MRALLSASAFVWIGILCFDIFANEPLKYIPIYVTPYYHSAKTDGGTPEVNVGGKFDPLLSSNKREDILAARDLIEADPQRVTPMTMMVLAIRLYDVGMCDESTFWFYAAKERAFVMNAVLDMQSLELSETNQAIVAFVILAGETINGYAFGDLVKQKKAKQEAVKWSEEHVYKTIFESSLPAKPGDRRENLKKAIATARERMQKEQAYFANPANVEAFEKARAVNEMDQK